jgi:hypothetical protein
MDDICLVENWDTQRRHSSHRYRFVIKVLTETICYTFRLKLYTVLPHEELYKLRCSMYLFRYLFL